MSIDRRPWTPAEHKEYEAMLAGIIAETTDTTARLDAAEKKLTAARKANKYWARDVERACLRKGLAAEIKNFQDRRHRALVSHDGRVLNMPKAQGKTVRNAESGDVAHQRELIELWTWQQIIVKRAADLRMRQHYDDRIAYLDKLLALHDLCPESSTPADAAKRLGINLEEFLGKAGTIGGAA